ncbi:serine/threonine protein kinase, partial [Streptomyces sp. MBT56]|nr:serine/threonine protein kinase [Streptomyces sp. MBT56]
SPAAPPAPVGPTTYRLPGPTGRRRQAPARSAPARRRSTREAIRRRPRVASAIAGTATFLAAVYLGMILFSPDSSSAGTPDQSPSSAPVAPSAPSQDGDGGAQPQGDQQPDGEQHGDRQ